MLTPEPGERFEGSRVRGFGGWYVVRRLVRRSDLLRRSEVGARCAAVSREPDMILCPTREACLVLETTP